MPPPLFSLLICREYAVTLPYLPATVLLAQYYVAAADYDAARFFRHDVSITPVKRTRHRFSSPLRHAIDAITLRCCHYLPFFVFSRLRYIVLALSIIYCRVICINSRRYHDNAGEYSRVMIYAMRCLLMR